MEKLFFDVSYTGIPERCQPCVEVCKLYPGRKQIEIPIVPHSGKVIHTNDDKFEAKICYRTCKVMYKHLFHSIKTNYVMGYDDKASVLRYVATLQVTDHREDIFPSHSNFDLTSYTATTNSRCVVQCLDDGACTVEFVSDFLR